MAPQLFFAVKLYRSGQVTQTIAIFYVKHIYVQKETSERYFSPATVLLNDCTTLQQNCIFENILYSASVYFSFSRKKMAYDTPRCLCVPIPNYWTNSQIFPKSCKHCATGGKIQLLCVLFPTPDKNNMAETRTCGTVQTLNTGSWNYVYYLHNFYFQV